MVVNCSWVGVALLVEGDEEWGGDGFLHDFASFFLPSSRFVRLFSV